MRLSHEDQMRRAGHFAQPTPPAPPKRTVAPHTDARQRDWQRRSKGSVRGLLLMSRALGRMGKGVR